MAAKKSRTAKVVEKFAAQTPAEQREGFAPPKGGGGGDEPMWSGDGVMYDEPNGDGGIVFVLGNAKKAIKLYRKWMEDVLGEDMGGDWEEPDMWDDCRLFSASGPPEAHTQHGGDEGHTNDYIVYLGGHIEHLEYVKAGQKPKKVVQGKKRDVGFWFLK